jgi:hypothetical protein
LTGLSDRDLAFLFVHVTVDDEILIVLLKR